MIIALKLCSLDESDSSETKAMQQAICNQLRTQVGERENHLMNQTEAGQATDVTDATRQPTSLF